MFLFSSCSCLCQIHCKQILSREWRCSWSSADTSEWSTSLLPTKLWLILEVWWCLSWFIEYFSRVNLELFTASDVMTTKPLVVHFRESVSHIAHLLLDTTHGGFPVVRENDEGKPIFYGFINRWVGKGILSMGHLTQILLGLLSRYSVM